jgi:uncharacterized iron-regulated membrane protein
LRQASAAGFEPPSVTFQVAVINSKPEAGKLVIVDTSLSKRFRSASRWIHTWLGITLGAVLAITCLTGSIVVFRQADRPFRAGVSSGAISLDRAAGEVSRFVPGARVTRARFPILPGDPYVFQIRSAGEQTERVAFDGASGRVLGLLPAVSWMDWMIDLHRNLLSGKVGRKIVGAVGILSLVLSLTAVILWLASGAHWKEFTRIRSGAQIRFYFELHRAIGLWSVCFVVLLSATGIALAYSDWARSVWESATGGPASYHAPRVDASEQATKTLDEYMAAARAAMPDGAPTELRIPQSAGDAVQLRFRRNTDFAPTGMNRVYLGPASGQVLSVNLAANWPLTMRLYQLMDPVHYGEFGGTTIKVLWAALGAMPSILFVSGVFFWWLRNKKSGGAPASRTRELQTSVIEPVGR